LRSPSERTGSPPASSICIISEVPDRGSPETMVIIRAFQKQNSGGELTAPRTCNLENNATEMIVATCPPGKGDRLLVCSSRNAEMRNIP
jgi:hypothetical protein